MRKIKVGVIFGGRSGEHDVSLMSATSVLKAMDKNKYEVIPIGITTEGRWITEGDPLLQLKERIFCRWLYRLTCWKNGCAFPVLHGPYGEDGTIQGLFEMLNIPMSAPGSPALPLGWIKDDETDLLQSGLRLLIMLHFYAGNGRKTRVRLFAWWRKISDFLVS